MGGGGGGGAGVAAGVGGGAGVSGACMESIMLVIKILKLQLQ